MLHDLVIVGAGPVGATLALALADSDLDVVTLDARPAGSIARSDRSLALSHGSRLIFERLDVWSEVAATPGAVTPITAIDISQRGGFGRARLHARDHGVDALGYVVSYRALQRALDAALARAGMSIEHGVGVTRVSATAASAQVVGERDGAAVEWSARLAAVADGGGDVVAYIARRRHDYRQVALVAKIWSSEPHGGLAFERFMDQGPMALLPEGDHYGLVWTTTPANASTLVELSEQSFLEALAQRFGPCAGPWTRVADRRTFPLTLEFATRVAAERTVLLGNAAQALHPVAGQGFNLGVRDAYELAQELLAISVVTDRDHFGAPRFLAEYSRRRAADRWTGIAFTHGLLGIFGTDVSLLRWPRGLALTLLDALPGVKRMFTRAMLYGLH
ncbi:MAG TPA: FAD-dependent monooxygenase [Casimicrobiaceae bacterium]|nr:FAD-dependent monooxygenase [Casimicrobiaceae bacterium]